MELDSSQPWTTRSEKSLFNPTDCNAALLPLRLLALRCSISDPISSPTKPLLRMSSSTNELDKLNYSTLFPEEHSTTIWLHARTKPFLELYSAPG